MQTYLRRLTMRTKEKETIYLDTEQQLKSMPLLFLTCLRYILLRLHYIFRCRHALTKNDLLTMFCAHIFESFTFFWRNAKLKETGNIRWIFSIEAVFNSLNVPLFSEQIFFCFLLQCNLSIEWDFGWFGETRALFSRTMFYLMNTPIFGFF